ncbi:MAG: ABC transporter ATP-binding protein [Anaerolineae bacterium]|nr:ABC transporter ATP-binding protein [Anaerolineae bacterium]
MIICDNLVKIYKMADLEIVALQGLDLVVQEGEIMALVGPSGSGKSTLMNILGGLDQPSAGRVIVDGRDLLKLSGRQLNKYRREEVGFVWQQPSRNLIPYLSAEENVTLPMIITGVGLRERRRRSSELLEAVGLGHRKRHRLAEMSGGEQQRVAIAVSLANYPRLLLADEPTGEVDSRMAQEILGALRNLNRELGVTILIVTHDPRIASEVDRVIAIRDGRTSTETTRQVLAPLSNGDEDEDELADEGFEHEVMYEELVVLDTAGRLQVPRDYLEEMRIGDRARVELTGEGILIRPVAGREAVASRVSEEDEWEVQVSGLYLAQDAPPPPHHKRVADWLRRRLGGGRNE